MITEFAIRKYRGLDGLEIGPFDRLNLVTGPNGVGKTALLEALWLYHGRFTPGNLWNRHVQRRPAGVNPLTNLSRGGDRIGLFGVEGDAQHGVEYMIDEGSFALKLADLLPGTDDSPGSTPQSAGIEPDPASTLPPALAKLTVTLHERGEVQSSRVLPIVETTSGPQALETQRQSAHRVRAIILGADRFAVSAEA